MSGKQKPKQLLQQKEQMAIEIRREQRNLEFNKRRNFFFSKNTSFQITSIDLNINITLGQFQHQIEIISQEQKEPSEILSALQIIQTFLNQEKQENDSNKKSNIQELIDSQQIQKIMKIASNFELPALQIEALKIIALITAGNQSECGSIVEKGGILFFFKMYAISIEKNLIPIQQNVLWALGNICGDRREYREQMLSHSFLEICLQLFNNFKSLVMEQLDQHLHVYNTSTDSEILQLILWNLANLLREKLQNLDQKYLLAIKLLTEIILKTKDDSSEVIMDASWCLQQFAIFFLVLGAEEQNQMVAQIFLECNIVEAITRVLKFESQSFIFFKYQINWIITLTIKACETTSFILFFSCKSYFLKNNEYLQKGVLTTEIYEALNNVMKLNTNLLNQELIKTLAFISSVKEIDINYMIHNFSQFILMKSKEKTIMNNLGLLFFQNIVPKCQIQQIQELVKQGLIQYLISLLNPYKQLEQLLNIMELIYIVLKFGQEKNSNQPNEYAELFQMYGGTNKLEKLEKNESDEVYNKSILILQTFYETEDINMEEEI